MKAIVYHKYGPPDVLQLEEVEKPAPDDNQVLVQVYAVSLNPAEAHMRKGILLARIGGGTGLVKPKNQRVAADFSGRVEAVGKNVTLFRAGDMVFGRSWEGGFAEYACASENALALKPANTTFEQAAAVPVAGVTALQSLRDTGKIQPGQKVLINGASGGVGTFTVQIAKAFGAHVTGVCSTRNVELVRSLGADRVIDYGREDFARSGEKYDLIIDNIGNRWISDCLRVLNPGGICVGVGYSSMPLLLQHILLGRLASKTGSKKTGMMFAHINRKDLTLLTELMEAGKVVPFVEKCYPVSEVAEAYRYMEGRHARGKLVVSWQQADT